jgi:tetratricopeptide (TPR) repeat protein/predicted transcriptional regulator
MTAAKDIPWFNPRQMSSETVLRLSTGREELLHDFYLLVRQRHREPAAGRHWLVTGPRGAGKSFFLCLVQAMWPKVMTESAAFVLLPEELPNVYAPHEWLREVERLLPGKPRSKGSSPAWQTSEKDEAAAWETALKSLLEAFTGTLLVIGVENFDMLLQQAFDSPVRASRLRSLMENEPRIMLLATAVEGEFDEAYEKRLFRQFEHHPMPRWNELDHRHYLTRRAELIGKVPTQRQLARIDAYSRFTGGSARVAAVLASAILDEQDPVSASADLTATLDRMSDYYRSLIERLPANTRKVFDALIRGGEPASQVELAARVHARQNDISRAFRWLVDYGYVVNERRPGNKEHSYRVTDRLFVQFYRMRYVDPDQPCQLAILADLLATSIEFRHKWHFAEGYLGSAKPAEAEFMAKLACSERGVDVKLLPESMRDAESLVRLGREWLWMDEVLFTGQDMPTFYAQVFDRFKTDEELRTACEQAKHLADAAITVESERRPLQLLAGMPVSSVIKYHFHASLLKQHSADDRKRTLSRFSQSAEALQSVFTNSEWVHALVELDSAYPLASSLTEASDFAFQHLDGLAGPTIQQAAEWAARAVCLWANAGIRETTAKSWMLAEHFLLQLSRGQNAQQPALRILAPIEEVLKKMDRKDACRACRLKGILLKESEQFDDAVKAFEASLAFGDNHPISTVDSLEQMAWCLAATGKTAEAMKYQKQALQAWEGQPLTERLAYNHGQIARHLCRLSSFESAWDYATTHKGTNLFDWDVTVEEFAEAIWDAWNDKGEAGAFQLGKRILIALGTDGLKEQFFIFFRIVDAGLPLNLLRDLFSEGAGIFTPATFESDVFRMLGTWLDYLEAKPKDRPRMLGQFEPDWAQTIQSYSQNLSARTRQRYQLANTNHSA